MPLLSPHSLIITMRALAGLGVTTETILQEHELTEREVDEPGRPSWDARFVNECGFWSHYNHKTRTSAWPFPRDLTTPELAMSGLMHNVLYETPMPGDIFLQWGEFQEAFIRSGVILDVQETHRVRGQKPWFLVYTVDGDTDEYGRLARGTARRVERRLRPAMGDKCLRWCELQHEGLRRLNGPGGVTC